jgi:predicted AlkP superfamily pyrophosphatase or phosphodiesterase
VAVCLLAGTAAAAPAIERGAPAIAAAAPGAGTPRLVVVISIDQFRADYLTRFADLWLPAAAARGKVGGFAYLMQRGAWFTDAHHDHYPLFTGPGHAVLLTGALPYLSGIVGNSWYDREAGRRRYCVEDAASPLVGAAAAATGAAARMGIAPTTLRVSTVGDELKMASGGRAKVWGLAFKDRAAVLMAGRLADGVLWFDEQSGAWITSRFYRPDGTLPGWVARLDGEHRADRFFGASWTPSVPAAALARAWTKDGRFSSPPAGMGATFPHRVTGGAERPGPKFYAAFAATPFGNDHLFDAARELVREERLGRHDVPDLLALNLSSNDYVGHAFGPDSPEVLDVSVRTDRQLAAFFGFLNETVPGGLRRVTLAVTADHGVAPLPGAAREARLPAGAYDEQALAGAAASALTAAFGPGEWVTALVEANLYLNLAALDARKIPHALAEETAAEALVRLPGIYAAYPRSRILEGRLPRTELARRVERSFHPKVSGDVVLVSEPYWMPGGLAGTTHGTPYAYDTQVPLLLAGAGIRAGRWAARASTLDLAPTLADLLGVLQPAGSEGRVLAEALAAPARR